MLSLLTEPSFHQADAIKHILDSTPYIHFIISLAISFYKLGFASKVICSPKEHSLAIFTPTFSLKWGANETYNA